MMTTKTYKQGLPCDAGELIPHEPPMLLVKTLVELADDSIEDSVSIVEADVPGSGPFINNGKLLPEYYIEVMAQAIAAIDGYSVGKNKQPTTGLLTGIENFSWKEAARPGECIRISVCKIFEFGCAYIFTGRIHSGSELMAEGQLKIWKIEE